MISGGLAPPIKPVSLFRHSFVSCTDSKAIDNKSEGTRMGAFLVHLLKLFQSVDEEDVKKDAFEYARKGYCPPYSVYAQHRHKQVTHRDPRNCEYKPDGGRQPGLSETVERTGGREFITHEEL